MSLNKLTLLFATVSVLLSNIPAHAAFPGKNGKIVFQSDRSGSWQLYTINADGSGLTQVTQMPPTGDDLWTPSFSPNGEQIAFCYDSGGVSEIYVINSDGSGLKQVTHDGRFNFGPHWSPDGKQLVFGGTFAPTSAAVITTIRSDGTGPEIVLTSGEWSRWGSFNAFFTPNGREIVFESQFGGLVSAAWIMNSDGTHKRRLTDTPIEAFPTDVSPDGTHIIFVDHGNTVLTNSAFVMDLDGKHIRRLTHLDGVHDDPTSYSPDGRKILLVSDRWNALLTFDVFTMNPDGSDITRISAGASCPTDLAGNCASSSWGAKPSE
jgi:Tol biopolymer transport system component